MMATLEVLWRRSCMISGQLNIEQGNCLHLNLEKTEVICDESSTQAAMLQHVPALCDVQHEHATLLGSPICTLEGIQEPSVPRRTPLKCLESGSSTFMRIMPYAYCDMPSPSLNCSMSYVPHHVSSHLHYRSSTPWLGRYCVPS